ncbi:RBBP9/YdeN family alpha/beta hydrolase [Altererythrobacter sp. C41]|uniref:RBBP9/YdeN family alpha/beta hydrolase n=1 Tax=Altererythrobacter sp. C41 TaxID=2806021 RepID=UPI0019314812|nr:alpha/beta hydrolase [Altererythrobacter sp. C41]MBM0171219.1 alpha/beta hydrolase [Altererythrobacter sp. C41]
MRQITDHAGRRPLLLTVPGIDNSGPGHWQTLWEKELDDCARVDLGMWSRPHRNTWVNKLNAAIAAAGRPVVLVAHSLGCHAVAWWNRLEQTACGEVLGALLVAPPNLAGLPKTSRLASFAPLVREPLRFPSILAASEDDPYATFGQSRKMARLWGSRLVNAGWLGHINADSNIGAWPFGRYLLEQLVLNLSWPTIPSLPQGKDLPKRGTDLRIGLE